MDFLFETENYIRTICPPEVDISGLLVATQEMKNGDVCLPCFKLSKTLHASPVAIADSLKTKMTNLPSFIERVESVSGYLNFFFNRKDLSRSCLEYTLGRGDDFAQSEQNGKTICIDYSSVNIAKPFHIGHLLTTVIGGSLYRIFKFLGYRTVGINHLGDWGTQFGKLLTAYFKWGKNEQMTMDTLLSLYVRFHKEAEKDDSLNDEARMWFKKIEDGDELATSVFEEFKTITLKEVGKVYDRLGITFDSYNGESFYNDKLGAVIEELKAKNLLVESDGAMVVPLDKYGMPPCLILKSDGASLYATRDIACALYRKKTYNFDKNLYVVAYQQNLHFSQLFKVLELMGYDWAKDCEHVPFGMVSIEGVGALSTRSGNVVKLADVIEQAVNKTKEIIAEKNPDLKDADSTAEAIGVGAVVFGALSGSRIKDIKFSLDKALNFDGETGPYLQYTHARCCSVLSKGAVCGDIDYGQLVDDDSFALIKRLNVFDDTVRASAEKYEPSILSRYLIDLAQEFNKFYIGHRIISDDADATNARLALTKAVKNTLKCGMSLILLQAPERM